MKSKLFILLWSCIFSNAYAAVDLGTDTHQLQFKGYFRVGAGISEGDTRQARFILPGARAKYRLGNEPETNVELMLRYGYRPEGRSDPVFEAVYMQDGFALHGSNFKLDHRTQSYLRFNDVISGAAVWLGRRYYDRKSMHLMNHYWLNSGQNAHNGGGIEGIDMGVGSLDIAAFRYHDSTLNSLLRAAAVDARWREIPVYEDMQLTAWAQYAWREKNDELSYARRNGIGAGFWVDYKAGRVKDTLAVIYQSGAAIRQADFNPDPVREDQGWDLRDARVLEINNLFFYEALPDLSVQWSLLFRGEERGTTGASRINWWSTGVRPIYYLTDYLNIALEVGVDYVDDEMNDRSGHLSKLTIALQFAQARGFYQRPVLRLFITAAQWSDEFSDIGASSVGSIPVGAPYGDDDHGWSTGAQLEWWW